MKNTFLQHLLTLDNIS